MYQSFRLFDFNVYNKKENKAGEEVSMEYEQDERRGVDNIDIANIIAIIYFPEISQVKEIFGE